MSTNEKTNGTILDAENIRHLIEEMPSDALQIFKDIIFNVRKRGNILSDAMVEDLAKKFADKAIKIADRR